MALDMYLKRHISQTAFVNTEDKLFEINIVTEPKINTVTNPELTAVLEKATTPYMSPYKPELSVLAGYWSNSPALNKWFIDNLNMEETPTSEVTIENLQELKTIIDNILNVRQTKSLQEADEFAQDYIYRDMRFLEPDTGSFDNDDEFYPTLEQTKEILETEINIYNVLKANDFEFAISWTYSASW